MKIQDIAFIIVFAILVGKNKSSRWFGLIGISMLFAAMPLFFMRSALFTAERLVIYALALFFTTAIVSYVRMSVDKNAQT